MNNFLYNTEITKEKFSISLLKIINEISSSRRDGSHMLKDIFRSMVYNKSKFVQHITISYNIIYYTYIR